MKHPPLGAGPGWVTWCSGTGPGAAEGGNGTGPLCNGTGTGTAGPRGDNGDIHVVTAASAAPTDRGVKGAGRAATAGPALL